MQRDPIQLAPLAADHEQPGAEAGDGPARSSGASLAGLCLIARLHHIAADPFHLTHQLGWPASHSPSVDDLLLAAKHLGLNAKRSRSSADRLSLAALPALALMTDDAPGQTRTVVLASATAGACCISTRGLALPRASRRGPSSNRSPLSPADGAAS